MFSLDKFVCFLCLVGLFVGVKYDWTINMMLFFGFAGVISALYAIADSIKTTILSLKKEK